MTQTMSEQRAPGIDRLNGLPRPALIQELLLVGHSPPVGRAGRRCTTVHRRTAPAGGSRPRVAGAAAGGLVAGAARSPSDRRGRWLVTGALGRRAGRHGRRGRARYGRVCRGQPGVEARFGHVFPISAAGCSPQDILGNLRARLGERGKPGGADSGAGAPPDRPIAAAETAGVLNERVHQTAGNCCGSPTTLLCKPDNLVWLLLRSRYIEFRGAIYPLSILTRFRLAG